MPLDADRPVTLRPLLSMSLALASSWLSVMVTEPSSAIDDRATLPETSGASFTGAIETVAVAVSLPPSAFSSV